ncbi:MAG: terminase family protein [Alphaproteobacteria bacterium]|nr:terminase family protein [Alphaproteobacteria bacterium]
MTQPLIHFLPYQRAWLDDNSRFKIGMFARQTGKTLTNAAEILIDCLRAELAGYHTRWVVLSRGERQASEMMNNYLKPLCKAYYALLNKNSNVIGTIKYSKNDITLAGGSRITALPANEDAARGFSANLYLDEFAFHQNDEKIWQALYPVISAPQFKVRITSTPAGKNNKFYQLMNPEQHDNDQWSRHKVDIYQAVKQGLPRDIAMLQHAANDPILWRQEYELDWLDDKHAWLDYGLIMSCESADISDKPPNDDDILYREFFIGIDIAVKRDLFVLVLIEKVGDILWCRHIEAHQQMSFAEQEALLDNMVRRYQPLKIVIDSTGIGAMPFERARSKYGLLVEGIHFTAPRKLHLASKLKQHFQNRTIRIPACKKLRTDLHAPQLITSNGGTAKIAASHSKDGHADRFWAMAMAIEAAETQAISVINYQGVRA